WQLNMHHFTINFAAVMIVKIDSGCRMPCRMTTKEFRARVSPPLSPSLTHHWCAARARGAALRADRYLQPHVCAERMYLDRHLGYLLAHRKRHYAIDAEREPGRRLVRSR